MDSGPKKSNVIRAFDETGEVSVSKDIQQKAKQVSETRPELGSDHEKVTNICGSKVLTEDELYKDAVINMNETRKTILKCIEIKKPKAHKECSVISMFTVSSEVKERAKQVSNERSELESSHKTVPDIMVFKKEKDEKLYKSITGKMKKKTIAEINRWESKRPIHQPDKKHEECKIIPMYKEVDQVELFEHHTDARTLVKNQVSEGIQVKAKETNEKKWEGNTALAKITRMKSSNAFDKREFEKRKKYVSDISDRAKSLAFKSQDVIEPEKIVAEFQENGFDCPEEM